MIYPTLVLKPPIRVVILEEKKNPPDIEFSKWSGFVII